LIFSSKNISYPILTFSEAHRSDNMIFLYFVMEISVSVGVLLLSFGLLYLDIILINIIIN